MNQETMKKIAIVFGIGATITATHSKDKTIFTDGKTTLEVAPVATFEKEGVYDVALKSDVDAEVVYRSPLGEAPQTETKIAKPTAKQSPAFGYGVKAPR